MTLPNERTRAVIYAREFLRALLDPTLTPRVPRDIRQRAYSVLRHFPWDTDLQASAEVLPDTWGEVYYKPSTINHKKKKS